jgi:signal peptidase II
VFNVADAAIVAGVAGLLYDSFVLEKRRSGRKPRQADA